MGRGWLYVYLWGQGGEWVVACAMFIDLCYPLLLHGMHPLTHSPSHSQVTDGDHNFIIILTRESSSSGFNQLPVWFTVDFYSLSQIQIDCDIFKLYQSLWLSYDRYTLWAWLAPHSVPCRHLQSHHNHRLKMKGNMQFNSRLRDTISTEVACLVGTDQTNEDIAWHSLLFCQSVHDCHCTTWSTYFKTFTS